MSRQAFCRTAVDSTAELLSSGITKLVVGWTQNPLGKSLAVVVPRWPSALTTCNGLQSCTAAENQVMSGEAATAAQRSLVAAAGCDGCTRAAFDSKRQGVGQAIKVTSETWAV